MTTYYTIRAYIQERKYNPGEDLINNRILYNTFDSACDEIEKHMREREGEFQPPNREKKKRYFGSRDHIYYYDSDFTDVYYLICKMNVEEAAYVLSRQEV